MKIVVLSLFGTVLLAVNHEPHGAGVLSRRLAALRAWPSHRNYPPRQ